MEPHPAFTYYEIKIARGSNEKYKAVIKKYIRNWLREDTANGQLSLKEFAVPFTCEIIHKYKTAPM